MTKLRFEKLKIESQKMTIIGLFFLAFGALALLIFAGLFIPTTLTLNRYEKGNCTIIPGKIIGKYCKMKTGEDIPCWDAFMGVQLNKDKSFYYFVGTYYHKDTAIKKANLKVNQILDKCFYSKDNYYDIVTNIPELMPIIILMLSSGGASLIFGIIFLIINFQWMKSKFQKEKTYIKLEEIISSAS